MGANQEEPTKEKNPLELKIKVQTIITGLIITLGATAIGAIAKSYVDVKELKVENKNYVKSIDEVKGDIRVIRDDIKKIYKILGGE